MLLAVEMQPGTFTFIYHKVFDAIQKLKFGRLVQFQTHKA
jgi:hypothetical protein